MNCEITLKFKTFFMKGNFWDTRIETLKWFPTSLVANGKFKMRKIQFHFINNSKKGPVMV